MGTRLVIKTPPIKTRPLLTAKKTVKQGFGDASSYICTDCFSLVYVAELPPPFGKELGQICLMFICNLIKGIGLQRISLISEESGRRN